MKKEKLSGIDTITMDVPLFIRMLEYAKEEAKTDVDLHRVTENILKSSVVNKKLTMSNYGDIIKGKKQIEATEQTMSSSSGSYEAPLFSKPIKRTIKTIPNSKQDIDENIESSGEYDVAAFAGKGRSKNPLKIDGEKSITQSSAVTGRIPKLVKGSTYVKINEKCKKFPYCDQGDPNAVQKLNEIISNQSAFLEFYNPNANLKLNRAIDKTSKKLGIPREIVEKLVLTEINYKWNK